MMAMMTQSRQEEGDNNATAIMAREERERGTIEMMEEPIYFKWFFK